MRAMVQDQYGSAEVMELREIGTPIVGETDVLIRVRAAGVNPADWAVMNGLPFIARPIYGLRKPKSCVRGSDVAGTVDAVGSRVTQFHPGDEVFGAAEGSFANFALASEDKLALKPVNLSFEQAATVPMAGLAALQAIRDHGKVRAGHRVLINGASGGIGTFAVQIARSLGAEVTGVCSTPDVQMVHLLGADRVIDDSREDFTRNGLRYDLILDNVGKHSMSDLRHALTPTGICIDNASRFDNRWFASAGRLLRAAVLYGQSSRRFVVSTTSADLVVLKQLIEAGDVTPVIDGTYALSETREAISRVAGRKAAGGGHARGKVAITVLGAAEIPAATSIAVAS